MGDRRVEAAENGGRRVQDDPETVVDPSPVDSGGPAEGQPVGACPPSGGGDPAAGPRDAADREGVSPSPGEAGTELAGAGGEGRTGGSEEAGAVPEAVRLVREGLQAMQALQQQTAEAHRLFLEGQEQAHRSLQRLLEAQQCWLEPAGEAPPARAVEPGADEPRASARAAVRAPAGSGETGDTDEPRVSARAAVQAPVPPRIAHDRTVPAPSAATDGRPAIEGGGGAPADAQREAIANLVREVVCEKTGYPPEMVELEMDIEADLGVDSIKRVEIIAALEERVPGFGGVKPQQMGEIRTLDQIVGFVLAGLPESPGAEAAAPAPERASAAGVAPVLLDVVAELTGYPLEMLDLDMDLEADLGIDSIKRVEILSAVEARLPGMPPVQPERMGELRTLRQIVESCGADGPPDPPPAPPDCAARDDAADEAADEAAPGEPGAEASPRVDLNRRVLHAVGLPPVASGSLPIAPGHEIRVTDDDSGLSSAIVACLKEAGHAARLVPLDTESEAPPPDGDAAVGGLILVAPATGAGEALWNPATEDLLKAAFARVRNLGEALVRAAARGGAILATVSRMDGSFGLSGGAFDAAQGGLAGLLKTAAREWERVICRAIDVAPDWEDAEAAAPAVVAELASDGPMEVGLDAGVRRGLELKPAGVGAGHPAIEAGDVVVLTGGARGVTAEAALALARRFRPTLVLLGRTSLEEAEPAWLAGLETEREIKAAIREHAPADGRKLRPRELKAACREVMARREVRANRARLEATGAPVHYRSVDVCDAAAVRAALDEVRRTRGPVRGLIHGAGTLQDSSIQNKSPEQFATVLDTKVRGLRSLLSAVALEELRHVVLFSSVSGRCGNAGQADYAAANEVLNKAAQRLAARLPAARVVALNWGPWDGGMVGPALREAFLRSGVDLIPLEAGGQAVAEELADAQDGSVEVVLGASFDMPGCGRRRAAARADRPRPASMPAESMHLAFERELDVRSHPFLRSHVLDGRPVLPAAMMIEWLAHAAVHMNPGLRFQGLDDVRVLRGVVLNGRSEALRFYAARPRKSGERYDVEVALRGVAGDGTEIPHARANVVLAPGLRSEPVYRVPEALTERSYARGVRGAYAEVLFHGEDFRGIREVLGYSPRGMVAGVQAAEPPARWMTDPLRSDWLTDPLALDCAFQLAILWCHEELGAVSLPSCLRRYRQYRSAFPMSGLTVVLEVRSREPRRMTGDLTFVSEAGSVVAQIEGYECAVDAALRAAFRRGAGLETAR